MTKLTLEFADQLTPQLIQTCFSHPLLTKKQYCVRGKTCGAFHDYGSFQWTSAVKALTLLMLRSCGTIDSAEPVALSGDRGSPASSLDYALDKECLWLRDMFGIDSHGTLLARRLLLRTNAGRKRPGPVTISLNRSFIEPSDIQLKWDGIILKSKLELDALDSALACQAESSKVAMVETSHALAA